MAHATACTKNSTRLALTLATLASTSAVTQARAAESSKAPAQASAGSAAAPQATDAAERVNVEKIKEKYWARGDSTELGVVQNRLYSKAKRVEFSLLGGLVTTDPFLSVKQFGGSLGYHFSEYFSAHLLAWKYSVSGSSANTVLEASGKKANTNEPKDYVGAEARASLLYGKLSLIGKSIIYYDFHLLGGVGSVNTETSDRTGRSVAPHAGLGQHFYLSRSASFNVDYRVQRYTDQPQEKAITSQLGVLRNPRTNWAHSISIGFSLLFGGSSE